MKKTICKIVISLLLILAFALNLVACSGIGDAIVTTTNKPSSTEDASGNDSVYPTIPSAVVSISKNPALMVSGNVKSEILVSQIEGFNVSFSADERVGLKSYKVGGGIEVEFETSADKYMVMDAITVDDIIAIEQVYYHVDDKKELNLSEIYAEYYSVEVDYTESGKVEGLYYMDSYYIFKYDENDRLISVFRDGEEWKTFTYNSQGKIITEKTVNSENDIFTQTYTYTENGKLFSVNGNNIAKPQSNGSLLDIGGCKLTVSKDKLITKVSGTVNGTFDYEYEFNGQKYLTSKTVKGATTEYSYLGDKVVSIRKDTDSVYYILDKDLNYVGIKYNGVKYYFAIDPYGNVMSLVDCDGNSVVEYSYDIWGNNIEIKGTLADNLGKINEIINLNGIYDYTLGAYFIGTDIYLPSYGIVASPEVDGYVVNAISTHEWNNDEYFSRSAVTDFAKIHDKVVSVATENLKEAGLDVLSNLYATDKSGNLKRLVDIYTVDYSITPFSTMNLIDGNQIYEVIYHSPDSMAFEALAEKKLKTIAQELSVSYFGDYDAVVGTMKFNGQFIYLGYLIEYKCTGNGVVEYQVKINKKSNYDQTVNIYDYDNEKYVCYVNNTFDLNFLDGVTIIPGITKETFDVIDKYLEDKLQTAVADICDQMLIYNDPTYYNTKDMNLYPDYWSQINLTDTTTYLEMQTDGSVKVSQMPAWETDGFQTKLMIGAGVILVTAVVATVAIMIPGANCVVVSICVGAAKGAVAGALSGFAFGYVSGAAGEFIGQVTSGKDINWTDINNSALNSAADGFATGAITGAIMGGISGGLNPKYCFAAGTPILTENGLTAIENISVGDTVWSYDYKTGEKSLKPVTATSVRETDRIITVEIGGEAIITTLEHPFYVVNNDKYNGYVSAKHLSVGDYIQTADGDCLPITSIKQETLENTITVYNFTVDDNHSYYVGENELLVHNASCGADVKKMYKNDAGYDAIETQNLDRKFVSNHAKWDNVNNEGLLKHLQDNYSSGKWYKVYENGYIDGVKCSKHYFQSADGLYQFDIKIKWRGKWS